MTINVRAIVAIVALVMIILSVTFLANGCHGKGGDEMANLQKQVAELQKQLEESKKSPPTVTPVQSEKPATPTYRTPANSADELKRQAEALCDAVKQTTIPPPPKTPTPSLKSPISTTASKEPAQSEELVRLEKRVLERKENSRRQILAYGRDSYTAKCARESAEEAAKILTEARIELGR